MCKIAAKWLPSSLHRRWATSLGGFAGFARPSWAQGARSQATYRDIEQTRGAVPTFFKLFPESGVAGA